MDPPIKRFPLRRLLNASHETGGPERFCCGNCELRETIHPGKQPLTMLPEAGFQSPFEFEIDRFWMAGTMRLILSLSQQ